MTKQNITKVRKGLFVGSALVVGASIGETVQGKPQVKPLDMNTLRGQPFDASDTDENTAIVKRLSISIPPGPQKWTKSNAHRFAELAAIRATKETTSESDEKEFRLLQQKRRINNTGSPDDMLSEWRRRRFIEEVLDVLNRNVRFLKAEDQAKLRSLRKT
jgi:hypothetical protein